MIVSTAASGRRSDGPGRARWIALGLLLLCSAAAAQDIRIGYVDMKRLFDAAPQVVNAREALEQEFSPRNETLLADEARLERMEAELAESTGLSDEERFEMEREIRNLQRSIDRRREDLTEELRFRTNAEKKSLEETIDVAVNQIAEAGEFDLILTSPVAYASDRIDVTDRVLQWLEEDFRSQQSPGGQTGQ
ncbi:OmpH family outer membrane protein [Wenzhouxiangella sediminis]|uniref:OmpH family outer membrane protein n=1 Tax=Wenzhouxiangella sediminis TaxID=1792836 RepID=A0A3E1K877_9GAMM|nr:OmpH family outer membrane protein [Wenzhouxiangella sediminis]RFF30270.1 OmpH family outer membrane protein [Wenzhouxiangella sediminis]